MLDGCGVELVGQALVNGFAGGAVIAQHANLNQAVGVERGFGFFEYGGSQAVTTNHDHGVEVVGFGAKNLALGRS